MQLKFPNHSKKSKNLILVSRSGRQRLFFYKTFFQSLGFSFLIVFLVLWGLFSYTPWVNNKVYDEKRDALVKDWFATPIPTLKTSFPHIFKESYASIVNVLFANPPEEESNIPTIRLWVKNNGLEE